MDFLDMAQTTDDGFPMYDSLSPESQLAQSTLDEARELLGLEPKAIAANDFSTEFDKEILQLIDATALG